MKTVSRWGLILIMSLQAACSLPTIDPVPTDHYYRLSDPDASSFRQVFDGHVYVRNFRSDGLHLDRAMLYSKDQRALVLEQHHYHFWQDNPPKMLQKYLVDWLRAKNAAPLVVIDPAIAHTYIISGRIDRFERHLQEATATVIVTLELQLQRRGSDTLLLNKRYAVGIDVPDKRIESAIPVYAQALDEIFMRFLNDTEKDLRPEMGTGT